MKGEEGADHSGTDDSVYGDVKRARVSAFITSLPHPSSSASSAAPSFPSPSTDGPTRGTSTVIESGHVLSSADRTD
jgi:hypothetical protein